MATKEITGYTLQIDAGGQTGNLRARIILSDAKNFTVGTLAFVEDGPIPDSVVSGPPIGYFPIARYADLVDMLRNERPVYISVDGPYRVSVIAGTEKVGEGEPAPVPKARF